MGEIGWDHWQIETLDDYIRGYSTFNSQQELADYVGKNLNTLKVKLTRRRQELKDMENEESAKRTFTLEEYITILSNRFTMTTSQLADKLGYSTVMLLDELDEYDNLECKEFLLDGFETRETCNDEYEIFVKLYSTKKMDEIQIAHILNRQIGFVREMIYEYEQV